jgi:hypothetical protein
MLMYQNKDTRRIVVFIIQFIIKGDFNEEAYTRNVSRYQSRPEH